MAALPRCLAFPAIVIATVCLASSARASGGLGSAWVQAKTDHLVNISWSDPPSPTYQIYCCDTNLRVCYKEDGVSGSCDKHGTTESFKTNPQRLVTVYGLSPSTTYHFTLDAFIAKEKNNGDYHYPKWRKLAEFTMTTDANPSPAFVEYFYLSGTWIGQFSSTIWTDHDGDYDFFRIGYKLFGSSFPLTTVCSTRSGPASTWVHRNLNRGWVDVHNPVSSVVTVVDSLRTCRKYLVVAYGFKTGSQTGDALGTAWCKTAGSCDPPDANVMLIDDNEAVVEAYASALHQFYCGTPTTSVGTDRRGVPDALPCPPLAIFEHVAAQHPELWDDYAAMTEDGDLPAGEFETIQYLEHSHRDFFDAWQTEPALVAAGMDMLTFVARVYPKVYASLVRDEMDGHPVRETRPTVYPNPFNPETTIRFTLQTQGEVSLSIYNVDGRLVRTLVSGTLAEGPHNQVWNGRDGMDQPVPSGIYFCRLVANGVVRTSKLLLLK